MREPLYCAGFSAKLTRDERERVLEAFRSDHRLNLMISTDVLGRGLDVPTLRVVVNAQRTRSCHDGWRRQAASHLCRLAS